MEPLTAGSGSIILSVNDANNAYRDLTLNASVQIFKISNTERMRLDGSGNLLVGRTTPYAQAYRMVVSADSGLTAVPMAINDDRSGTSDSRILAFLRGGTETGYITSSPSVFSVAATSALAFQTASSEQMRITNTGLVGIGTTSPGYKLQVSSGGGGDAEIVASNSASVERIHMFSRYSAGNSYLHSQNSNLLFGTFDNYQLLILTNNTERARFDASGNFLVGTSSTSVYNSASATGHVLEANGTVQHSRSGFAAMLLNRTSSDGNIVEFFRGGTVVGSISVTGSATSYNTSSDYRLKNVDGPITNSGAYVDALKPVQGSWKSDGSRFIGLLAHEVQEVSETPIATGEKDGEQMQAMDYSAPELIANLIAEIQSLRARVAQLEERK
jgi:hypothetical protein